jgi:hypothetical protein
MPSDLLTKILRGFENYFSGGSRHAIILYFIRGCCSEGLWYFTGVLDVIIRHVASFPARRLKILAVYIA